MSQRQDCVRIGTRNGGNGVGNAPLRLALKKGEAAAAMSMSDESFDKYVRPYVRVLRLGGMLLYPVAELERFLAERASSPLEDVA